MLTSCNRIQWLKKLQNILGVTLILTVAQFQSCSIRSKNPPSITMATTRQIIYTDKASHLNAAPLPLSQAVLVDKTLYVSGNLGTDENGKLLEGIEAQTRRTLEKIGYILNAAGATFKDVVKVTVLLADITQFQAMNKVYAEFFTEKFPARMAFQVACLPIPAALVEIEAIAIVGGIRDVQNKL